MMDPQENKMGFGKIIKTVWKLMRIHRTKFIFSGFCAILSILCNVITPIILGDAINIILEGSIRIMNHTGTIDFPNLFYILAIIGTLYLLNNIFSYLFEYYTNRAASDIIYALRERMANKVLSLPMGSVDENHRGYLLSLFTTEFSLLNTAFISSFSKLTIILITIIFTLAFMIIVNIWMALIVVLVVSLSSGIISMLLKFSQRYFNKQIAIQTDTIGQVEEIYNGHEVIRSFNYEEQALEEFVHNVKEWNNHEWKFRFFSSLNYPIMNFNNNLGFVLVALFGGILVVQGTMSVGRILTFIEYLKNFEDPLQQITEMYPQLQGGIVAINRIFNFLEMEEEENPSDKELKSFNDEIRFENVSFGYTEDEKIIDNFNLTVKKGEKIAIIGENGVGKTTLIKLLMRLYDIDSGKITIDGVNINEYDKHSLRSFIGIVLQESWLFSDTIEENIRYGNLESTCDEILTASKQANTDAFIRKLPDKYKTILNEDGTNLSQGQKQLLTIARAIISQKEILVLDEATSNVDTRTELLIQEALDNLMENKTSFIVAHRLATVRNADKIIVLGKGRVIEQGNHEELLAQKGYYYNTLKNQENS
ncbi:ABC transporter ATP-binding protein [uncultured Methanobrevibacter sp.]|uniref:ABC transporter ATP-binding protein n=3 Tax=Methanobrevibacter sp. TaxID=66852 RepID=UPI0025E90F6E|nr:ABC transporter ATP-binding protein [uncultured Methanobrevibacter sp.]